MITGMLNRHPRAAIAVLKSPQRNDFRGFYEKMLDLVE